MKTERAKKLSELLNQLQADSLPKVVQALKNDKKALVRLPTGTGKTVLASKVIAHLSKPGFTVLWLTHRNELVVQSRERVASVLGLPLDKVSVFGRRSKGSLTNIVVASIPTLTKPRNLKKFKKQHFDLVIADEAHHSPAATWSRILDHFEGMKLGLTATHIRPDNLPIEPFFGSPVINISFKQAQAKGYIAQDDSWVILTNSVIHGAPGSNGEYKAKDLERLFSSADRNCVIVEAYKKYGRNTLAKKGLTPKTVCYCINIEHAKRLQNLFRKHQISSSILVGDTKRQKQQDREDTFASFRDSDAIEVLCVVDLLNEGVDIPAINCALMARPTRSNIVYSQQVGRAARREMKDEFVLLDFVDNTRKEYGSYIMSNLKGENPLPVHIVTEYLTIQDPIKVEKQVKDIMAAVERFEIASQKIADEELLDICTAYDKGGKEWESAQDRFTGRSDE